jgi:hypothetical protein
MKKYFGLDNVEEYTGTFAPVFVATYERRSNFMNSLGEPLKTVKKQVFRLDDGNLYTREGDNFYHFPYTEKEKGLWNSHNTERVSW